MIYGHITIHGKLVIQGESHTEDYALAQWWDNALKGERVQLEIQNHDGHITLGPQPVELHSVKEEDNGDQP